MEKNHTQKLIRRLKGVLTSLLILAALDAFSQQSAPYLGEVITLLGKTWPDNRTVNLVFHGHSVPAGYFKTPVVNSSSSYPQLSLSLIRQKHPHAVTNAIVTAIGGEHSEDGQKRFASQVLTMRPDVVFIDYALNDRRIGIERASAAWSRMIEAAQALGVKVVLITPTPDTRENIKDEHAPLMAYAAMIRGLAGQYRTGLVDGYAAFRQKALAGESMEAYMSQSNHPNEAGHRVVADMIGEMF